MRRVLCALGVLPLLGVFALWPGRADGQAPRRIVVLNVLARGVPPALGDRATGVLRAQAAQAKGYAVAPAPALRLRAMLLALGCAGLDSACLGKIARQLEVQQVLLGELGRTAGGYLLRVQLFDAASNAILKTQEREIGASEDFDAAAGDAAALALGGALQLTVECSVEGAVVLVNGNPVGTTPLTTSEALRAGTNEVVIRAAGHKDFVAKVSLRPGKPFKLAARMEPLPVARKPDLVEKPAAPVKPPAVTPFYGRWWFWAIVGAAVAGGATAAYLGTRSESPTRVGVEF